MLGINRKNIWHDRDSNPEPTAWETCCPKLTAVKYFWIKRVGNSGLRKKEKRPYWMNNFSCILHILRKIKMDTEILSILKRQTVTSHRVEKYPESRNLEYYLKPRIIIRCMCFRRFEDTEGKWRSQNFKNQNKGAKVLSARLVKVLNLLITSLTTCLCNVREHAAIYGKISREQPEITAEVQGNYLNFKQILPGKKTLFFLRREMNSYSSNIIRNTASGGSLYRQNSFIW